jgi:hypothetical protein
MSEQDKLLRDVFGEDSDNDEPRQPPTPPPTRAASRAHDATATVNDAADALKSDTLGSAANASTADR